jgi:excisionase family DNA binding protein
VTAARRHTSDEEQAVWLVEQTRGLEGDTFSHVEDALKEIAAAVARLRAAHQSLDGLRPGRLEALPPTLSVAEAARLLGVSGDSIYEGVRRDEIAAAKLGRSVRVLTAPLLSSLSIDEETAARVLQEE